MFSQFRPPCSSTYGAALSAHLAALLASSMKLHKFILEGVSHVITAALKAPAPIKNAQIDHVIQETITSFPPSSLWEAKKISRSENFCALYVAYRTTARVLPGYIPSLISPSSISICSGKDPPIFNPPKVWFFVFWHATCWSTGCVSCSSLSCYLAGLQLAAVCSGLVYYKKKKKEENIDS